MSTRGRKKRTFNIQNNTLFSYLSPPTCTASNICATIINDIIDVVVVDPNELVTDILDGLLSEAVSSKKRKHDGVKLSEKTIAEWKSKYPWLQISDDKKVLSCTVCCEMKNSLKLSSVWANEGSPNIQISGIVRHNLSNEHDSAIKARERKGVTASLETECESALSPEDTSNVDNTDKILFNTVYYAAKSEIPSNCINSLLSLQTKNGLGVNYTNLSWDSITDIQNSIAHILQTELIDEIKASGVFAIMLDESTDVSVEKRLSICVRYVKGGEPITKMLCNVPLTDGCAHTIINCLAHEFEKFGIDLAFCTSLATDGAAVMMGKKTGVGRQLVSKYSPFCVQTHCMAHRLNLACSDAMKKNEYLVKFREKFNSLYHFMSGSSIRTLTLKTIQRLLEEPELSIKEPFSIRWLGLRNAVLAVFESYGSVLATLSKFAAEKNATAKGLYKYFKSYKVSLVIALVLDVHNELALLSCALQKRNILFSEIQPLLEGTVAKLDSLETRDGECLQSMKNDLRKTEEGTFYHEEQLMYHENMDCEFGNVRKDYIGELKRNISRRFRKEDSAVFQDFSQIFEHNMVKSSPAEESNKALESLAAMYGYEKTVKVIEGNLTDGLEEHARQVAPLLDPVKLEDEWPRFKGMILGSYANLTADQLCKRVILLHSDMLPNFAKLSKIALCLQPTSVECERSFSTQNRLKNKQRASIGSEKLNTLMTISMLGPNLEDYDPCPAVVHWIKQKKRRKGRLFSEFKPRAKKQKLSETVVSDD